MYVYIVYNKGTALLAVAEQMATQCEKTISALKLYNTCAIFLLCTGNPTNANYHTPYK